MKKPDPPAILWCSECSTGYGAVGDMPKRCPSCNRPTIWMMVPYILTVNDRRFLKSLRISLDP